MNKNMKFLRFVENESCQKEEIVIVFAKFEGKWLLCRHKDRETFEVCGGHIEKGEAGLDAAKRELYEESGAIAENIKRLGYYSFEDNNKIVYGGVFYANIKEIEPLPNFEMKEIKLFEDFPNITTYPQIYKNLIQFVK